MEQQKTFVDRVHQARVKKDTVLCIGLDPQLKYIPPHIRKNAVEKFGPGRAAAAYAFTEFFGPLIPALAPYACVVKPNSAFYEQYGSDGINALEEVIMIADDTDLEVILDAKRGDGGDTAEAYANSAIGDVDALATDGSLVNVWGPLHADAVTVQPGIGEACLAPFLARVRTFGMGVFVVTKTSFTPDSFVEQLRTKSGLAVWERIALWVEEHGSGTEGECGYRNFGVVCGATYPEEAVRMREILRTAFFLVPGYGSQGAPADDAVVSFDANGFGGVVNSSRKILYAYRDKGMPGEQYIEAAVLAAKEARDDLNASLDRAHKRALAHR